MISPQTKSQFRSSPPTASTSQSPLIFLVSANSDSLSLPQVALLRIPPASQPSITSSLIAPPHCRVQLEPQQPLYTSNKLEVCHDPCPAPLDFLCPYRCPRMAIAFFRLRHAPFGHCRSRGLFPRPAPRRLSPETLGQVHPPLATTKDRPLHRIGQFFHSLYPHGAQFQPAAQHL